MTQLTWLVTGCSSGFGEAFVHRILARGDKVIASGRKSVERLAHLKDSGAAILDLDVTWSQEELDRTIEKAIGIYGGIDVLVSHHICYLSFGFGSLNKDYLLKGRKSRNRISMKDSLKSHSYVLIRCLMGFLSR